MDELKPMERSEPKTAEIVSALREMLSEYDKVDYAELVGAGSVFCGHLQVWSDPEPYKIERAISRLEQLERENAALKFSNEVAVKLINRRAEIITELTARAERAEANVEDAHQRGYEEGMDEARHQYEEDGYV